MLFLESTIWAFGPPMDMKVPLAGLSFRSRMRERNLLLNVLIAKQIPRRYTPPNDRAVGLAFDGGHEGPPGPGIPIPHAGEESAS